MFAAVRSHSIVLAAALALGSSARLAGDDSTPPKVKVSVVAILASEEPGKIDPLLKDVAKEIQKLHPHLKVFRVAKMSCKSVPVLTSEKFELVADQSAAITVLKPADKGNCVKLKVTPPTLGEITYTTTCGKFFPIVTRYQTSNRESLIIAVRVQPCTGGKN